MLCLPEFDTYHILPEYAREPDKVRNQLALRVLKHRTMTQLKWRVFNNQFASKDTAGSLLDIQMGCSDTGHVVVHKDMNEMNEAELMNMYNKALDEVGLVIDPEALAKAQQQQ